MRILYVSDFDPRGFVMPVSVARKFEFLLYRDELYDLDIQLRVHEQRRLCPWQRVSSLVL